MTAERGAGHQRNDAPTSSATSGWVQVGWAKRNADESGPGRWSTIVPWFLYALDSGDPAAAWVPCFVAEADAGSWRQLGDPLAKEDAR